MSMFNVYPRMVYNEGIYRKYRALAITNHEELKEGETYYSNCYPEEFVLKEICSYRESDKREGLADKGTSRNVSEYDSPAWFYYTTYEDGKVLQGKDALSDRNMNGMEYNPWMIFKDAETAKACREELVVTWEETPHEPSYDFSEEY